MKHSLYVLIAFLLVVLIATDKHKPVVYIIGDSTAAEKNNPLGNPERGWGMMLQGCFTEDVIVSNHAVNGRSSKSFRDEGRWQKILESLKPGDYVIIQFGHNDSKPDVERHTDPNTTFAENLERYALETKTKGAVPILMSPVARRCFYKLPDRIIDDEKLRTVAYGDEQTNSDTLVDTHGAYRWVARRVAQKLKVCYIDANAITSQIEQRHGVVGSRKLHVWLKPGECASIPQGRKDNTHYNIYGAFTVANALAEAIGEQIPELKPYVRHYDAVVSTRGRGNYFSLDSALSHKPVKGTYHVLVMDGQWKGTKGLSDKSLNITLYGQAKIYR